MRSANWLEAVVQAVCRVLNECYLREKLTSINDKNEQSCPVIQMILLFNVGYART